MPTASSLPAALAAGLAASAVLLMPGAAIATPGPRCNDFPTREAAQHYYDTHGQNLPGFDNNGNGVVCEHRFPPSPPASPVPESPMPAPSELPAPSESPLASASPEPSASTSPGAPQPGAPAPELPITGEHTGQIAGGGAALVLAGIAALALGRRRRVTGR